MSSIKHLWYALPHSSPPFICITLYFLKGFHGGRTNSSSWRTSPTEVQWLAPGARTAESRSEPRSHLSHSRSLHHTTRDTDSTHGKCKTPTIRQTQGTTFKDSRVRNIQVHGDRWKSAAKMKAEGNFLGDMTITSHRTSRTWFRDYSGNNKGQDMFSDPGNKPPYTSSILFSSQTTCLSFTYGTEKEQRFEFKELGKGSGLPTS